ncbi:MAG: hypothetical protein QOK40_1965, partial [Miltoncostaeaceae bacterium]|nr:hypothetical protein [Miltoncostaeaceae bacterium]
MAEHAIAVLVDFENMARPGSKSRGDFDIQLVLNRLAEKGRVLVKRAYADWSRYREAKHDLQNAGLELIEMPSAREGAKNRADIKLAVDAMELAYSRDHLDNFVIVSGDSDFTPLVGKLRELNKRVTGVGNRESSSELLIANCDEFIFYDLLASTAGGRTHPAGRAIDPVPLLRETLTALQREGVDWPLASVVKDSMRRKYPAFDESDHGYSTFSKFLAEAGAKGMVRLETDPRSGTYRVELADGRSTPAPALPQAAEARADDGEGRRRRRRRRGEGPANGAPEETALEGMPADAEVFEIVVTARPEPEPDMTGLPPIGEPISYEDMIMLGPELDSADVPALADVPDLAEASDVAAEAARPAGRRRRRTREPLDVAEIADADRSPIEAAASAEAAPVEAAASADAASVEAAASADAAPVEAEAPVAAAVEAEAPPTSGRRRVRRRSSLGAVEDPAVPRAEALHAPAAAEPQPIVAEPEAPAAAEAAPASPRRRARRSAAAAAPEAEAAPAPAPPDEAVAEPAAEPEVKPTPRRRTRKAAAEEEPTAGVAVPEEADAAPAEDAPAPRKRRSR